MSLADALNATDRPRLAHGPRCSIAAILAKLDGKDQAALLTALGDPEVQGSWLARVLTDQGHRVNGNTVNRHRRRDCSCG